MCNIFFYDSYEDKKEADSIEIDIKCTLKF